MNLVNVILILAVVLIVIQFWRLRSIAEYMVQYANRYCSKHKLQYISLARISTSFKIHKGRLDWLLSYQMEFSSDGETEYTGIITSHGKNVVGVELPPYRVVSDESIY
jgi:hypothetical protein